MSGVKFIPLKRCLICNVLSQWSKKSCSGCGHLFIGEATDDEIRDMNMRYERANYKNKDEEDEE